MPTCSKVGMHWNNFTAGNKNSHRIPVLAGNGLIPVNSKIVLYCMRFFLPLLYAIFS